MAGKKRATSSVFAHPNSRKVRQLERRTRREKRLDEQKKKQHAQLVLEGARFFWFREQCIALGRSRTAFSLDEARALTQIYLGRNDEEVASLKALKSCAAGRVKRIEALTESEVGEFQSPRGIVIPDITDKDNIEVLTEIWDGRADTLRVVPRLRLSCGDPIKAEVMMSELKKKIKSIEEVRERAKEEAVVPKKVLKFQIQKRVQCVKKLSKMDDIVERSRLKAINQQQARLKRERKALFDLGRSYE